MDYYAVHLPIFFEYNRNDDEESSSLEEEENNIDSENEDVWIYVIFNFTQK